MARILSAFHDSLANDPPLTFNPGVIVGGTTVTFDAVQNRVGDVLLGRDRDLGGGGGLDDRHLVALALEADLGA